MASPHGARVGVGAEAADPVVSFLHELRFEDLPDAVIEQARRCVLDLMAVGAAGSSTTLSRIVRDHAVGHFGAGASAARMMFDGRRVSPPGAALAGGMTIDSIDAHDGHPLTKGHAGAAVLPSVLACADCADDGEAIAGHELLTVLVVGYEIATRAGLALHATAADYHSSGAWSALACAAVAARLLRLDQAATGHALGIAEYHAPRSPMMRCIDHPTMVKDGSGWAAMAGVDAAYLAADGFTGSPAALLERGADDVWADLGARWRIMEHYTKPYPVCRWAHPAVDAALALRQGLSQPSAALVERVEVETFAPAVRLATRLPATTEEAQYSLPFCVAAALVHGRLGVSEIDGMGLRDGEVARLSTSMTIWERPSYSERFPAQRCAQVTLVLRDGRHVVTEIASAKGDPNDPLSAAELDEKYRSLTEPALGRDGSDRIRAAVSALGAADSTVGRLLDAVFQAPALVRPEGPAYTARRAQHLARTWQ